MFITPECHSGLPRLSPITYSRFAASNRQSRPIAYGASAPIVYPCYTFGIGLVFFRKTLQNY